MFTQSGSLSERIRAGLTPLVDRPEDGDKRSVTSPTLAFTGESLSSLDTAVTDTDMGVVSSNQ